MNGKRYACCQHCGDDEGRWGCPEGGHYLGCDQQSVVTGHQVCVTEPFAEESPWTR